MMLVLMQLSIQIPVVVESDARKSERVIKSMEDGEEDERDEAHSSSLRYLTIDAA